ncbi:hypothetical protein FQN54_002727 [Arachnomyces sp. PD_36]|nr:hypothetical protein FQN54_002727 [Arachnomyces sp. PD_36]
MVSLWPWRGTDDSPASFEKTLSTLSGKITRATTRLDTYRQQARSFRALWTLYTTFAYLLYAIILGLVLGWQNWTALEYAGVAGGPVIIYLVRLIVGKFYEYRINRTQNYLDDLQKQRDTTIEKLKEATKYNSTQQLLEKYGAESPKPGKNAKGEPTQNGPPVPPQPNLPPVSRTGIAPPPTANIRRSNVGLPPSHTPSPPPPSAHDSIPPNLDNGFESQSPHAPDEPEFAPNAFNGPPPPDPSIMGQQPPHTQYSDYGQHRWYDRLVDVLLGEDETLPKNRLALICAQCRLINGQAPPGVKNLEEVGRWRCGGCGSWNGHDSASEARRVIADIQEQTRSHRNDDAASERDTPEPEVKSEGDQTDEGEVEQLNPPKTRRRGRPPKGGKK